MMYDNRISVKKFGDTPRDLTWEQFLQMAWERFLPYEAGEKTWENYFGEEIEEKIENEPDPLKDESAENRENTEGAGGNKEVDALEQRKAAKGSKSGEKHSSADSGNVAAGNASSEKKSKNEKKLKPNPEHVIAPAQKNAETQKIQNAEPISEGAKLDMNPPEEQTEIVEKSITRKEYFDSLTAWGVAAELAKAVRTTLKTADLTVEENWGEWLKRKVDYQGRDLEEEIEQEG